MSSFSIDKKEKVVILETAEGQHSVIDSPFTDIFHLNFDQEVYTLSRTNNNLTFVSVDTSISLINFFEVEKIEDLPVFTMINGTRISASDYLQEVAPEMDLKVTPSISPLALVPDEMEGAPDEKSSTVFLTETAASAGIKMSTVVERVAESQPQVSAVSLSEESKSEAQTPEMSAPIASFVAEAFVAAQGTPPQVSPLVSDGLRAAPVLDPDAFLHAAKVYETQLSSGSKPNASALTQTIKLPAGFTVDTNTGWVRQPDGSYVQQGNSGKFVFNGGKLTYTLTKNAYNPDSASGTGKDAASDGIVLRLKHPDSPTPQAVYCSVAIVNDAPIISIVARTSEMNCGATMTGAFGIHFGADGPQNGQGIIVEFTVNGITTKLANQSVGSAIRLVDSKGIEYGILTLAPEGNDRIYTFKATPNVEATLSFRVAAVDGDGDIKYANANNPISLAIVKPGGPDPSKVIGDGSNEAVDEAYLTLAVPGGLLTKEIAVPDGFVVDTTVRWSPVAGQPGIFTLQGSYGRLMYNSNSKVLTYTLTGKYAHDSGDGNNFGFDGFGSLQLVDSLKNTYSIPCKVQIIDDVPLPSMIMEGTEVASGSEVHGAWDVNFGADGKAGSNATVLQFALGDGALSSPVAFTVGAPVSVVIGGIRYGTLTLNANGSFVFKAEPNVEGKISFYIGATDADGDFVLSVDPAYVLIAKPSNPDWIIGMQEGESFDESHLGTGTNNGNAPVKHDLSLPANFTIVVEKGGWTLSNGKYILVGTAGTLIYDKGTNVLSYELNNAMSHGTAGTTSGIDDFGMVVIVDVHGNEYGAPCQIVLRDDAPEVAFSSNASSVLLGETASGTWAINFGADGKAVASALQLKLALWGSEAESFTIDDVQFGVPYQVIIGPDYYGTITVLANGSFSFETVAYARQARMTVSLGATDGDGDFVEQSFNLILDTLQVRSEHTILGKEIMMDEANLPGGSLGNAAELTQVVTLPADSRVDTSSADWVITGPGVYTLQGQYGYLTFQNNVLTYTLKNAYAHTGQGADSGFDSIYVSLLDTSNIQRIVVCKIEIKDDIPVVELVADSTKIEAGDTVTGEWKVAFGADGKLTTDTPYVVKATLPNGESGTVSVPAGGTVEVIIGGNRYGFLTLNADGTFAFETEANLHDTILTVSIGAYDSEGDLGEESFVVVIDKQVTGPVIPVYPIGHGTSFDEANLANGTTPNAGALTQQFVIPKDLAVQPNASDGWAAVAGQTGVYQIQGIHGVLEYNQNTNTLSYTLTSASSLHGAAGKDSITEILGTKGTITLIDADDNTYVIQCKTTIVDDVPVVSFLGDNAPTVGSMEGYNVTGELDLQIGADGPLTPNSQGLTVSVSWDTTGTITGSGETPVVIPFDGSIVEVMTSLGKLVLHFENGKVQYEFQALMGGAGDQEILKVVAVDSDNDTANDSITVTLNEDFRDGSVLLDEAGIDIIGSNQASFVNTGSLQILGVGSTSEIATLEWDPTTLPVLLQANGAPDGTYTMVTWKTEGTSFPSLVAYDTNGNAVLTLSPVAENGYFTGKIDAFLTGAFKHDGVSDTTIDFSLGLTLTGPSGKPQPAVVDISIKDDTAGGDKGTAEAWVEVNKIGLAPQNVVIAFDASGSVSVTDFGKGIEAVIQLLQTYIDEGLEATFSFLVFGDGMKSHKEYTTAEDLRDFLIAAKGVVMVGNTKSYESLRNLAIQSDTDYQTPLKHVEQLYKNASAEYANYAKTLYFISDGAPRLNDLDIVAWQNYYNAFGTDINAYAIGVGDYATSTVADQFLSKVTGGNMDNIFAVTEYSLLLEQLVTIVEQQMEGEMLGSLRSADLTSVVRVQDEAGIWHSFKPGEDSFTVFLGNNVQITIFKDGNYVVTKLGEMNGDLHSTLRLIVEDADGDVLSTYLNVVCKNVGMTAYDNVNVLEPNYTPGLGASKILANFNNSLDGYTISASGSVSGIWKTDMQGTVMPIIPGISGGGGVVVGPIYYVSATSGSKVGIPDTKRLKEALGDDYAAKLDAMGITDNPNHVLGTNAYFLMKAASVPAGGILAFNWGFRPDGSENKPAVASDAAFWVLKDAAGNVVDYGLLHQGNDGLFASGIKYVTVKDAGQYTLTFVTQGMVPRVGTEATGVLSPLIIGKVYLLDPGTPGICTGNVVTDASPDGLVDGTSKDTFVTKITIHGIDYAIGASKTIDVTDAYGSVIGVLTILRTGAYSYQHKAGYDDAAIDLKYTLLDSGVNPPRESTAELHIRSADKTYEGTEHADVIDNSLLGAASENSLISAGAGADLIKGGTGAEIIYGGLGNDTVHGNDGDDQIHGGLGNDMLYGDKGNDTIYGDAGNDFIYGGEGNDLLYGNAGDDYLDGGAGNDTLYGGTGINTMRGGAGSDVFAWDENSYGGRDYIVDFASSDEGDKLSFAGIGNSADKWGFLDHIDTLELDSTARELSFTLVKDIANRSNSLTTVVDITFREGDADFDMTVAAYTAATSDAEREEALLTLLKYISG